MKAQQEANREKKMLGIKGTTAIVEEQKQKRKLEKENAKKLMKEQEFVKSTGMSMALVRMAFNSGGLAYPKKSKDYYA